MEREKKLVTGYKLIFGYMGTIITLIGVIMLLPLFVILFYHDESKYAVNFLVPALFSIGLGLLLSLLIMGKPKGRLKKNQDSIIVVLLWVVSFLLCALPWFLDGRLAGASIAKYSFSESMFEVVSGFTTTGLSMVDVTTEAHIYLMFRSIMLFFGGVGLVLVMLSVFSDTYGLSLYQAEGHADRLLPNLVKSSRVILAIYLLYITIGTVLYVSFGMQTFDAINHSIAAVSTGGFSTKAESIGAYNSLPIEITTIVLMFLGSTNFFAHLYLLRGKIKEFFKYNEVKVMLIILALIIPVTTLVSLYTDPSLSLEYAIRYSSFHVVSALTGTGFQLKDMSTFASPVLFILIFMMVLGGNTGSTSGGLKMYRVGIIFRNIRWTVEDSIGSKNVCRTHYVQRLDGREYVDDNTVSKVHAFAFLYMLLLIIGTIIFAMFNDLDNVSNAYKFEASLFEFASAIGTVGLGMGITHAGAPNIILWTTITGMFLGRLEIYVVLTTIIRVGKDGRNGLKNLFFKKSSERKQKKIEKHVKERKAEIAKRQQILVNSLD